MNIVERWGWPRIATAILLLFLLGTTLRWLQNRFETSDHKKALALVPSYRAQPHGPSIETLIRAQSAAHEILWDSEMRNSCLGHVRVNAAVFAKPGTSPVHVYSFDVDLTGPSIHPTDPITIKMLQDLSRTASVATP